jgi:Zn-dependent protease with chaperone function
MKPISFRRVRFFAAGSLAMALVALALIPINNGGCSTMSTAMTTMKTKFQDVTGTGSSNQPAGNTPAAPSDSSSMMPGFITRLMPNGITKYFPAAETFFKGFFLSTDDEPALGQAVAMVTLSRYPLVTDPALNAYVTKVGRVVAASSLEPGIKYYFGVIESEQPNAFSGPHGYIFITTGALKRMRSEGELAGVLGHEIGHVCLHHGLAAMKTALMAQGAVQGATAGIKQLQQFSTGTDAIVKLVLDNGYLQPQEIEADQEGVCYAMWAGYDPMAYVEFLRSLESEESPTFKPFSTHPGIAARISAVLAKIEELHAEHHGVAVVERFQANVHLVSAPQALPDPKTIK